jgi:FkbM family methyltransferase
MELDGFLAVGGVVTMTSVRFGDTTLEISPAEWGALHHMPSMLVAGAKIWRHDEGMRIVLPGGLVFESGLEEFGDSLSALVERFINVEYGELQVKGAVVVDIGAFIGDSAVFFGRQGAYRVHSYEPVAEHAATAVRNVKLNGYAELVTIVEAAVAGQTGRRVVTRSSANPFTSRLAAAGDVQTLSSSEVDAVSFADVLDRALAAANGRRAVLKMDCEGTEFELMGAESPSSLSRFSQVFVEYHDHPPDAIHAALDRAGFAVEDRSPRLRASSPGAVGRLIATNSSIDAGACDVPH